MKIQLKIALLCIVCAVLLFTSLVLLNRFEASRLESLISQSKIEKERNFDDIVSLKGSDLSTCANDYTYWDDMVTFVGTADPKWAKENVDTILRTYNITGGVWIYNRQGALAYVVENVGADYFKAMPDFTGNILAMFKDSRLVHFFINTPAGVFEVRGATIHPTADPERKTSPDGYFMVGRLWDSRYISEISGLAGVRMGWGALQEQGRTNASSIAFSRELMDFRAHVVAKLQVAFDAPAIELFKRSSRTLLILLFFYYFLFLALITFFFFRWVILPLSSISMALEEHNTSRISAISVNSGEFGQMAQLISNYFRQEDDLRREIAEKSRMIEALHLSEDKFSKVFRSSPVLMALTYFDSGVYIDVNDVFLESFGYSRQEVIGKSSIELGIFTPKERERMLDQLKLKGTVSNMEIKFMARAGQERIMLFSAETVDMEGRKVIINVAKDITERISMESELKRKIEELEKFNKFAVGREVKMIELKNRIRELEAKLAQNNR